MEARVPCRICSASILQSTAAATDGRCMPCWKDPGRIKRQIETKEAKERELQKLKADKVIQRELKTEPTDDPWSIVTRFTSLLYCDGLDQVSLDEILEVLHSVKQVEAPMCEQALQDLLDFIEKGCSPNGFFNPALVEDFLYDQRYEGLREYEKAYEQADQEEQPCDQLEKLLSE